MKKKLLFLTLQLLIAAFSYTSAKAQSGNALDFDGTLDQVTIPANAAFDFTTGTIECWLKPGVSSNNLAFISMRTDAGTNTRWSFHINEGANTIGLWNGTAYKSISVNINPNTWYHVALVITTSNAQVYVNGVLAGTIPSGMNSSRTGRPLVIGSPNDPPYPGEWFLGSIDEVRVWNVARSSTDIAANMNSYITSGDPQWANLVAYYRFDQGNAGADNTVLINEVVDYSGNCNKGTLSDFTLTGATSNWVFTANAEAPVLTTNTASSIGLATATLSGNILSTGETDVTTRGFEYSTTACMATPATVSESGTYNSGTFSLNATGLNSSTTYYYRSFSTNLQGTNYGETQSFTTSAAYTITYNGNVNTGGTAPVDANSPYAQGATVNALGAGTLVNNCYPFMGWNTAADGSGTSYAASATFSMPANNVTLYAQWQGAPSWQKVGSSGISADWAAYISLAISNGTPYVAYSDLSNSGKEIVKKFDGNNWIIVGNAGFSADQVSFAPLAMYNGTPYVAFKDLANSSKVTVMKFDGNNWINVGSAGFSAGEFSSLSLAIDNNGTPFIAYGDVANGEKATVMKFDGINWVNVGNAGFSAGTIVYTTIALYNGTPYVAYRDDANSSKATVMKFDGNNWVNLGNAGFSADEVRYTTIALYNGTPYVAYCDDANSGYATVMKFDGNNWVNVGNAGFSESSTIYTSIAIDNNGTPYVAYNDNSWPTVMKFDGNNWLTVGNAAFSEYRILSPSLAIYNGIPYLAYTEGNRQLDKLPILKKFTGTGYSLTYNGNGNTSGTAPVDNMSPYQACGSVTIMGAGDLVKTGHTFNGWNTAADGSGTSYAASATFGMPANNVTLYAQWTIDTYTVTYNANGSTSGIAPGNQTKNYGVDLVLATNSGSLAKTGHTFAGWNTLADGSGTDYAAGATYAGNTALTLYAKWTADTYTVAYNANGATSGTEPGNQTKTYGVDLVLATNSGSLLKTGHSFAGWNTLADGSGTDYAAGATYTGNTALTLYAKWTADTYAVAYNANGSTGGTAPADQTKTYGVDLVLATNSGSLLKTGHSFAGWNTLANGSGTDYAAGATYTGNTALTLYAKWTADTYTVAYNANGSTGGTAPGNQTKTYGVDLVLATNSGSLVKTGHTFAGWNTLADGSGTDYAAGATYTNNAALTLFAKWTIDTYTVTYNANAATGGTAPGNQTKTYGVDLVLASNSGSLVKTSHTFAGWNTLANGSGTDYAAGATYTGNAALTLFAKWSLGTSINSVDNQSISIYPNPSKGKFVISCSNKASITITDFTGREIYKVKANSNLNEFDISKYGNGVYLVKIQTDKEVFTTKIIKE